MLQFQNRSRTGNHRSTHAAGFSRAEHAQTEPSKYITMTNYDDTFKGVDVIFDKDNLNNTLGEFWNQWAKSRSALLKQRNIRTLLFSFPADEKNV
jgi:bisphosphoglycerate-independent phosphoglycerate mutase (AlkP superfamily)